MPLSQYTVAEVRSGGASTGAAFFDPGQTAGMFTDGAATAATSANPVFTSASYNFVAGDVGAWVYIASGANWTPGWYKITSVAANAATLNAAIGSAVLLTTTGTIRPDKPSTVLGAATTSSPTGATWSIDYSQQDASQFTYTDLISAGAGLTVSSAAQPFAAQQVGNGLNITSGTNFTVGRYVIASVSAGVATVIGPANITTGVGLNGNGMLGGAANSPLIFNSSPNLAVAGTYMFITGTFSRGATTDTFIGWTGTTTLQQKVSGYGTVRGDGYLGRDPVTGFLITTNFAKLSYTSAGFTARGNSTLFENLAVTQTGNTGTVALDSAGQLQSVVRNCVARVTTNTSAVPAMSISGIGLNAMVHNCDAFNESTTAGSIGMTINSNCLVSNCFIISSGSASSISLNIAAAQNHISNTLVVNGSGIGVKYSGAGSGPSLSLNNCTISGNASDGFNTDAQAGTGVISIINCIIANNGGYGLNIGRTAVVHVANARMVDNVSGNFNGNTLGFDTMNQNIITADSGGPSQDFISSLSINPFGYALIPQSPAWGQTSFGGNLGAMPKGAGSTIPVYPVSNARGSRRKRLGQ